MDNLLAQAPKPTNTPVKFGGQIGEGEGFPSLLKGIDLKNSTSVISTLAQGISNILAFLTIIAGLWFGWQIIQAAFTWLTSAGDKNKISEAQQRLTHSFIGLFLVVAALAIIDIAGTFFGIDILLTDPQGIINQLTGPTPTPLPQPCLPGQPC